MSGVFEWMAEHPWSLAIAWVILSYAVLRWVDEIRDWMRY